LLVEKNNLMKNSFILNSASITDRGLSNKRPENQDSHIDIPENGIFAVADGVGGGQAGEVASKMAMEVLQDAFANYNESLDAEELMKSALQKANTSIFQMSHEIPKLATMATTIVAVHLEGNIATIGHVGDSRLYRLDSRGNLFRETNDHSMVEEEVRAGRMTVSQAENHPNKNVISRALGAGQSVEVEVKTIMFDAQSIFLLCSDGITRHLADHELREIMLTCGSPLDTCREMKNLCFSRGAEDNLTVIAIKIEGSNSFEADETTIARPRIPYVGQEMPPRISNSGSLGMEPKNQVVVNESSRLSVPATARKESAMFRMEDGVGFASDDDVRQYETLQSERTQIIKSSQHGFIRRFFAALLWIFVGGLLGIAGTYYFLTNIKSADVPPLNILQQNVNTSVLSNVNSNANVNISNSKTR
jgi:PPM family protein phosphatase